MRSNVQLEGRGAGFSAERPSRSACWANFKDETMNIDIVRRLRQHALPDPHDDREVLHAPLLREAADEIEALRYSLRLDEELIGIVQQIISRLNNRPMPNGEVRGRPHNEQEKE